MKRFYRKKSFKSSNKILVIAIFVIFFDVLIFNFFAKRFSDNIVSIIKTKVDEISRYYLNDTLKKYLNLDVNDYIKVNLVNNNIVSVDIDNNKSNELLKQFLIDIESNVKKIEGGDINEYHNLELLIGNDGIIMFVPTGVFLNNALLSNMGPKIPIKASFLQNVETYIDVDVEEYGINNSLIKLYLVINIKEVVEMPTESDVTYMNYKFLVASKLINGKVPNILGTSITDSSSIVNSSVN